MTEKIKTFSMTAEQQHSLEELCRAVEDFSRAWRTLLQGIGAEDTPPVRNEPFILPEDLAEKVAIETTPTELILRPKSFLGTENFRALLDIVKKFGGNYVSMGRDSHFIVPKPRNTQP